MLKDILHRQREHSNYYFDTLELNEAEKITEILLQCKGTIFITGVGKSGLVAKKIAFTMISTGTRALYISPTDALHGDLGLVSEGDVFIFLSKSGESDELLNLVPAIRNKGATLVGVVCHPQSRLSKACHHSIILPMKKELCPFDMAPTTSAHIKLLFGDLLTVALMQHKKFSIEQYASNHPSGRIGKRITLKVRDLMLTGSRIPLCSPENKVTEILVELSDKRCGCILVVNEKKELEGIFTDGDLRRALQKHGGNILDSLIKDVMSKNPRSIAPDLLAWEAMKIMETPDHRIMMMPVLDENKRVLGLLHLHDIIQSGL